MRKNLLSALAIGAGLAIGASAVADIVDGITVVQPVVGNEEFAGPNSVLTVNIPAGQAAAGRITDATELRAFLTSVDAGGTVVAAIEVSAGIDGAPVNYNDGAGNAGVEIDLSNAAGTVAFFNAANAAGNSVRVVFNTVDIAGAHANGVQTALNADEAVDQSFTPDPTAPTLTNVFITLDGLTAYFVFSESLNNGNAGNDDNHTVEANLDANGADFQVNTTNTFDGTQVAPTNLSNPGFLAGSNNTVIGYDIAAGSTLVNGSFVRPFYDNVPSAQNVIFDVVGNQAGSGAVQIAPLTPLQITGVEFLSSATVFGAYAGAIRVTYNLPLNAADLGDAAFYGFTLFNADGTATDIDFTGVSIDPDNNSAVLLNIFINGNDFIFSDGLSADGTAYRISTDLGGNLPSSIFDTDDYATAQNVTGTDAIAPALVDRSFHDLDNDGKVDAVAFIFDETIAAASTNGVTVSVNDGVIMTPFAAIDPATGELVEVETDVEPAPNNQITGVTASLLTVEANGVPTGRTNNAVVFSFDPDAFGFDGTAGNGNVPGTGDAGVFTLEYDAAATGASLADANGNEIATIGAGGVNLDRAAPVTVFSLFHTGDNQAGVANFAYNASNVQFLAEQDGQIGDQDELNRATLYFSEDISAGGVGAVVPSAVLYGSGYTPFEDAGAPNNVGGDFIGFDAPGGVYANGVIFNLRQTAARGLDTSGLQPGVQVTIDGDAGIEDAGGNLALVEGTVLTDRTAPYVALQADVNNTVFNGAYLVDDTGDNLVNRILLIFSEPIDPATLNIADFETSRGTVTAVGLDADDATQRTVEITISGSVSIESNVSVTYNGDNNAAALVASDITAGGLGNAVDDVATTITQIKKLQSPLVDTDAVAIQPIVGTVTINGQPVQQGTKVFASVAVPTVYKLEARQDNVFFQYRRFNESTYSNGLDDFSLDEFTSWLLGVFPDLYVNRGSSNTRWFSRSIDDSDSPTTLYADAIHLNINANNLNNITFQGTGEVNSDHIKNGKAWIAWDLIRSADGRLGTFFRQGYDSNGMPVVSSGVIDNADGAYSLYVSAPITAFNGISRFNSVNWPIIIWVELPDGTRHVASSLLTSVNGGPVNFSPANRTQSQGNAVGALSFNIELNNIGVETVFDGWNTIPFGRVSGWAGSQSQVPVRADGIPAPTNSATSPIQVGANGNLPAVDALGQFAWFYDANNDGVWNRDDDGGNRFADLYVDAKMFPHFAFTMTSFGVQAGSSITNLVGGYGLGFFSSVPGGVPLGMFQFGAPLDQPGFFTTNNFPNNSTTQGWALLARTQAGEITSSVGSRVDYVIWFNNRGPNGPGGAVNIEVSSLAVQNPSGTNNPNDLGAIDAGDVPAALFTHFQP